MNQTIYALGFFDGVHIGHAALLEACRALAREAGCRCGAVTSNYFCSVLAPQACCLSSHDLGPVLHMDCAISFADSLRTLFPWHHFRNDPVTTTTVELFPECSLGNVIVLSITKCVKCRLKDGVRYTEITDK